MSHQERSARRSFILDNHPDRGGDPAAFIAGLRLLDQPGGARAVIDSPQVRVHRTRRTAPGRWVRRLGRRHRPRPRNLQ